MPLALFAGMRTTFVAGLALGLFAIACAPTPPKKQLVVTEDDGTGPPSSSRRDDSDLGADDTIDGPDSVESADTSQDAIPDDESPGTDDDPPADPTDGGCKGWFCPPTQATPDKTVTCQSSAEGNQSVAIISYSEDSGMVRIASISILVTNKNHRNKNDANIFVKLKGFNTYSPKIQTGDILPDAKTVAVPLPNDFAFVKGSAIRIDTNFDDSFGDPTGSCEVVP